MQKTIESIVALLDSKKAENIQVYDMKNKDYITDAVVIATTLNERHGASLVDELKPELKKLKHECLHSDTSGEWAVLDTGDILVHLMSSEYRSRYNIEAFLDEFEKQKAQHIDD